MAQGDDAMEAKTLNASASSFTFKASAASFVPTKAAAAEPFYPQQPYKSDPKYQEGGYYDGATESQPEELPKRKSFADLGLDSLGFVSDEDGDEDAGQDPASPLSKQRRQAVVQQLESGMSGQHPQHEDYHHQQYPDNGEYYDEGAYHHGGYHPAAHYPSQTYGAGYDGAHYHQHAKAYAHRHQHDREYGVVADGEWSGAGWEGAHGRGEMNELDEREFLMLLQESFQGYSLESLEELLVANGGDISLTVEILTELDVEVKPPEPPALDDESNFPTLGGGGGGSGSGGGGEETREPPEEMFRSFTISGGMSNVRGGAAASAAATGNLDENGNKFADRLRTRAAVPAPVERAGVRVGYGAGNFSGRSLAASQQWVETGDAVSNQYAATREDARDHMRLRNVCFQQATQAYLSGNKALAKELSRKGRSHAQAMASAHQEAAERIFAERNSNMQNRGNRPPMLDLHGLHVAEALSMLQRELPGCRSRGSLLVHVLVGTGHHTKGVRTPARLPSAVAEFLHHRRIRFWEPQAGMLEVDLSSGITW